MLNFRRTLRQLQAERSRAEKEIERLDQAIEVFQKLIVTNSRGATRKEPKTGRKFSAATRRKMAKSQKARWAKQRQEGTAKN
jgi:hypothetical protein